VLIYDIIIESIVTYTVFLDLVCLNLLSQTDLMMVRLIFPTYRI